MTVLRPLAACALIFIAGLAAADPPASHEATTSHQQERQKTVDEQDEELYQDMMKAANKGEEENPDQVRQKQQAEQKPVENAPAKTPPPAKTVKKTAGGTPAAPVAGAGGAPAGGGGGAGYGGGGGGGEEAPASVEESAKSAEIKTTSTAKKAERMAETLKKSLASGPDGMPGAGGPPGAALKPPAGSNPADPKTPQDLALASMSGFSGPFTALGLHAGRDASGEAAILRADGRLASPEEVETLKERISQEPIALMRRPDFFNVLPRERFQALKEAYRDKPALRETAFKHVEMSAGERDFMRSASCDPLAGGCNPAATKIAYRKGDFIPPEDLNSIRKKIAPEGGDDEDVVETATATPKGAVFDPSGIDGIYAKLNGLIGSIQQTMGIKIGEGSAAPAVAGEGPAEEGSAGGYEGGGSEKTFAFSRTEKLRADGAAPPALGSSAAAGAAKPPRAAARRARARRSSRMIAGAGGVMLLLAVLWIRRKPRSRFEPLPDR